VISLADTIAKFGGTRVPAKEITDIKPEVNSGYLILGIMLLLFRSVMLSIQVLTRKDGMIGKSIKNPSTDSTTPDVARKTN
jgi:hypothetical protein